jgi:hypothetical protein
MVVAGVARVVGGTVVGMVAGGVAGSVGVELEAALKAVVTVNVSRARDGVGAAGVRLRRPASLACV